MYRGAAIADTSCLIVLAKTNALGLLHQLYAEVIITEDVYAEFGDTLPEWIEVRPVVNKKYQQLLELNLDKGESSAIALAMETKDTLLIIDDLKARKEAKRLGFSVTGTLGVLYAAKQQELIPALKPYIDALQSVGFRIAAGIVKELLMLCHEREHNNEQ
jgi:predicted nucleic acid-binding protein